MDKPVHPHTVCQGTKRVDDGDELVAHTWKFETRVDEAQRRFSVENEGFLDLRSVVSRLSASFFSPLERVKKAMWKWASDEHH